MSRQRPIIKVCGITRQQDALACVREGVDWIGLIFHEPSPRNVTPEQAAALDTGAAVRVGLFVRQSEAEAQSIMEQARLDMVQLAGDQDEQYCKTIGPERVIRVFWPERYDSVQALEQEMQRFRNAMAYAILDAGTSGGGHGRVQDFSRLAELQSPVPWLLAGGLSPVNLPQAMAGCLPAGYDLNSGLESAPGLKDEARIKQAVELIRKG